MDTLERDRSLIESILIKYTEIPYAYGDFHTRGRLRPDPRSVCLDERRLGRPRQRSTAAWSTSTSSTGSCGSSAMASEHGVVTELLEAGIPKDRIVMAFKPPERRRLMEFAVA